MRPLPGIHVPTLDRKLVVLKLIYSKGWRWSDYGTYQEATERLHNHLDQSYMVLWSSGIFYASNLPYLNTPWGKGGGTLVNSPAHLVSYCLTLGERQPKVFV